MSAPHRPSVLATAIAALLSLFFLGALSWLTLVILQRLRRVRRWPKPRRRDGGRP